MLILKILLFPQFAVTVYQGGGWYITTEVIEIDHIQCYRFGQTNRSLEYRFRMCM